MKNMTLINSFSKTIISVVLFFFGSYSIVTPYSYAKGAGRMDKAHHEIEKIFKKINEKYPDLDVKLFQNSEGVVKIEIDDPGDTNFTYGQVIVNKFDFHKENLLAIKKGKRPAMGIPIFIGIKL